MARHSKIRAILDRYDQERLWIQKLDRIITGSRKLCVYQHKSDNIEEMAFCAPKEERIWLNFTAVNKFTKTRLQFLALCKGFNYHEVAHLLFTFIDLEKDLDEKNRHAFNVLEDQRIEALFGARFSNARKFLANNVMSFIAKIPHPANYLLLYGRRAFVPASIIAKYKGMLMESGTMPDASISRCEKIIDEFMLLSDKKPMIDLANEFASLMPKKPSMGRGTSSLKSLSGEMSRVMKRRTNSSKKILSGMLKNGAKDSGNVDGDMEEISRSAEQDVNRDVKSIEACKYNADDELTTDVNNPMRANNYARVEKDRLKRVLKELRTDLEQTTVRNRRAGRIDVRSAMRAEKNGSFNIFKKFRHSRLNKTRLAVTILVDVSGSMGDEGSRKALEAAWVICTALEEMDNLVMVVPFSNRPNMLKNFYGNGDWVNGVQYSGSSTHVDAALKITAPALMKIKLSEGVPNLMNIVITDGYWDGREEACAIIEKLKRAGVTTIEIDIGDAHFNNSQYKIKIPDVDGLATAMKSIIKDLQKTIIQRIVW